MHVDLTKAEIKEIIESLVVTRDKALYDWSAETERVANRPGEIQAIIDKLVEQDPIAFDRHL